MHKIEFGNITREFPESISEMTVPQYRYFCYLELNRVSGNIKMNEVETAFVYFILNMVRTSKSKKVVENVTMLRKLVHPYYNTEKIKGRLSMVVNLDFVENPIPILKIKKGKKDLQYFGPAAALQNCSYEEVFVHAHNAMLDFINNKDIEALDRLVAILYRPAVDGKRPLFDQEQYQDLIPDFEKLAIEVKYGVFLFFASSHKFLTTHTNLDIGGGNTVNIAQLFAPDPNQVKGKGFGAVGVIFSLAKTNVFGNSKETGRANVIDVLVHLVQLHEEAKNLKREYDKRNSTQRNTGRRKR